MNENQTTPVFLKDITGVKLDLSTLAEQERHWKGQLADMKEKKTQKGTPYWIFKSEMDDNGFMVQFTTFSSTQKVVIEDALLNIRPIGIVYDKNPKFGSYGVICAELPDGTYSTKEAKDAWKKGNAKSNRSYALQGACTVLAGNKDIKAETITSLADELLKWIEKDA